MFIREGRQFYSVRKGEGDSAAGDKIDCFVLGGPQVPITPRCKSLRLLKKKSTTREQISASWH